LTKFGLNSKRNVASSDHLVQVNIAMKLLYLPASLDSTTDDRDPVTKPNQHVAISFSPSLENRQIKGAAISTQTQTAHRHLNPTEEPTHVET
jgi:hypothetical protein